MSFILHLIHYFQIRKINVIIKYIMKKILTFVIAVAIYSSLSAANYFVDTSKATSGVGSTWETAYKTLGEAETAANGTAGVDNIYIKGAVGGITISSTNSWTLKAENYYFSCDADNTGTNTNRTLVDKDGNGIIELWEFKCPTIYTNTYSGSAIVLVSSTTLDGLTVSHNVSNKDLTGTTMISLNIPNGATFQNCIFRNSTVTAVNVTADYAFSFIKNSGVINNCLIEKNTASIAVLSQSTATSGSGLKDLKCAPILNMNMSSGTTVTTKNSVIRNNNVSIDNTSKNTVSGTDYYNNSNNIRGLILNVNTAGTSANTAEVSDCLIYNNQASYTGSATYSTAPRASILGCMGTSSDISTVKLINNTIASNKITKMYTALNLVPAGNVVTYLIYNNAIWNNYNETPVLKSMSSQSAQNIGTVVSSNIMDVGTNGTWGTNLTYTNNKIDLGATNTATNGPQFINPSTIVGNSNGGTVETADWRLNTGSYLIAKGAATSTTGIANDKSAYAFATATNPAVGAYEAVPVITTSSISDITGNSATSGGTIVWNGGSAITASGVCWSTSQNPTTLDSKTTENATSGSFTSNITSLTTGVTYYVRAYATNGTHTVYGMQLSFTTLSIKPEPANQATNFAKGAVTSSAIPLTFTSAVAGAQAPDGYLVKMSTSTVTDPVDATDPTDVTVLTGGVANVKVTASPISSFTGLTAGTMYHYKIYSYTNSSSQINFNTTSAPVLDIATSPAAVTGVTFTPTLTDFGASTLTANLSWTNPASFDAVNHTTLVFVKYNSAITVGTPTNATSTYTASTNMASGSTGTAYQGDASAYCVYKGTGTSVSLSGMTTGANYYVLVLTVYNSSNSDGTCSYSSSVGATANATMYKKEPISYPANLAVSNVTSTSISLTWTPSVSNSQAPDGYMVISKALQNITYPVDGTDQADVTAYTNNVANIKASPQSSTGINSFTNMTPGTTYYYKVFPYTNSGAQINYKTSGSVPSLTYATLPNAVTNVSFSSSTATSATINWAAASGYSLTRHSTLVFIKAVSAITLGTPVLAPTAYTANTTFGSGTAYEGDAEAYCVYNGDGTSISVTGLSTNTNYHVLVYTVVDAQNTNFTNSYSAAATTNALAISSTSNISSLAVNSGSELNISAGELVINQNTTVNTVIVAPGAKLSLGAGNTLTATNGITLQSDATGTATFVDTNNDAPQAVSGTVQQYLTAERNWYTASPIAAGTAAGLSLGTSVQSYSESAKSWSILSSGDALVAGKGYVSVATTGTGNTGTVSFNGTLNTGTIAVPVTRTESGSSRGFNLVANPYPSYLDWSLVKADGANSNIGSTMWFRTKNTLGAYTFATHNGTSGETVTGTANTTITKFIPPLQAFWIRVNANVGQTTYSTNITFRNSMRAHRDDNGNKLKAPKVNERTRLRLQLANGTETDETLIYFDSNATNDFNDYDSPKMLNNSTKTPDLYSKTGNERLVINGLKEVTDNLEVPLGFSLNAAATLKLKATEISNLTAGTRIYLLDKVENKQTELTPETEYSFNTTAATIYNESRFSLIFRAQGNTTAIDNTNQLNAQVFVNANNQITIIAPEKASYSIYNAMGQLIENGTLNTKRETRNAKHLAAGVYVVKINNQSTRVIVK
jgi:hypothetical protein